MPIYAYGLEAVRLVWQFGGPAYVFAVDGWRVVPWPTAHRPLDVQVDHTRLEIMIDPEFARWMLDVQHDRIYRLQLQGPPPLIPDDWQYQLQLGETRRWLDAYIAERAAQLRRWATTRQVPTPLPPQWHYMPGLQLNDPRSFIHITNAGA